MRRTGRRTVAVLVALVAAALTGAVLAAPAAGQTTPDLYVTRDLPPGSLVQPVGATPTLDNTNDLLILERRGTVRRYDPRTRRLLPGLVLDIRASVNDAGGEQGLLGLAVDPAWRTGRPYLFAAYTSSSGALHVVRYRATSPRARAVSASTAALVLVVPHPRFTNHNGGQLLFGRDGLLYIGTGDGGGGGDPLDNARRRTTLSGKILRIDTRRSCAGRLYCIPPTNPYARSTTLRREIWAYGVRNPWRFSQDPVTGLLYVADVGQNRYEEVSRFSSPGVNLGWPCREGPVAYDPARCTAPSPRAPRWFYPHSLGASVIGGPVYRGGSYPSLTGRYIFGDFVSGRVFLSTSPGRFRTEAVLPQLTAFGEVQTREVWALTYNGALYRLRAR